MSAQARKSFQSFFVLGIFDEHAVFGEPSGHGSQSMMGLSIESTSVAMNLRTVRISKSKKKFNYKLEVTKVEVSPFLVV